jgi:hypothetical protein
MFNSLQKQKLRDLSRVITGDKKDYPAAPNAPLEAYIKELREEYPELFLTPKDLSERVFMDQPRSGAYARYVRSHAQSPRLIAPVTS